MLDERAIERLVAAAGYDPATPVAVGVSSPSISVFAAQGEATEAGDFDCDSVGYAGSLAKQVTGACAALLAQGGALDVEAPIADWLPELPPWAGLIRVRHLIHHTGGLPTTDAVWEEMTSAGESDWTSDGVIAALSKMDELEQQPGDGYAYSNVGYICLARIIERSSGNDLNTFVREHLFEPVQMRATTLWSGPASSPPNAALAQPLGSPAPLSVGDGGLWTSVRDLLRWNEALLGDTLGVSDTLHTTGVLDDGTPLDYAWGVRVFRVGAKRAQSHGGGWEDATAKLVRLPDLGVSFAALALDGSVERMTTLSSLLHDELFSSTTSSG
ncbi:MAG: serine hydrolase domain-containing protein [Gaiellales bacterium]